ncbi:hypothetical protein GQ42DRAFT_48653 [Ramicandelaber brevisporus]|nr:hypothetical protein GQ42DRAFT_48653 [Ramicandelaber brevisporus]
MTDEESQKQIALQQQIANIAATVMSVGFEKVADVIKDQNRPKPQADKVPELKPLFDFEYYAAEIASVFPKRTEDEDLKEFVYKKLVDKYPKAKVDEVHRIQGGYEAVITAFKSSISLYEHPEFLWQASQGKASLIVGHTVRQFAAAAKKLVKAGWTKYHLAKAFEDMEDNDAARAVMPIIQDGFRDNAKSAEKIAEELAALDKHKDANAVFVRRNSASGSASTRYPSRHGRVHNVIDSDDENEPTAVAANAQDTQTGTCLLHKGSARHSTVSCFALAEALVNGAKSKEDAVLFSQFLEEQGATKTAINHFNYSLNKRHFP